MDTNTLLLSLLLLAVLALVALLLLRRPEDRIAAAGPALAALPARRVQILDEGCAWSFSEFDQGVNAFFWHRIVN